MMTNLSTSLRESTQQSHTSAENLATPTAAVYGPVQSWRFGRWRSLLEHKSLGIDPIGAVSTCSFNCVYCQLGEIQVSSCDRRIFVPTAQIRQELESLPLCSHGFAVCVSNRYTNP